MNVSTPLSWLLLMAIPAGAYGPSAAGADAPAPIRFRRVFVPEARIGDWPLGAEKYLPIDVGEFNALTAAASSDSAVPTVVLGPTRYVARWVDGQLVGRATIDVERIGPSPAVLALEPCNLALGEVAWEEPEAEKSKGEGRDASDETNHASPVLLGLGGDGRLQAVVERSGRLRFDWSLAGRRDAADAVDFLCEIPGGPAIEWLLDLPEGLVPVVDHGVVVGGEPVDKSVRRWRIELGGLGRFQLRLLPVVETDRGPRPAPLIESRVYDLSPKGLEVSSQWKLPACREPLRRMTVLLDPELQLVSARCGETLLTWTTIAGSVAGQPARIVLTLPEPVRDAEQMVRLGALGRLELDRPWRLPRIRAEGCFWQEGTLTLLTPDPLVIDRIAPIDCRQTATAPLSAPRVGESMQFQAFGPDATVEVLLTRRPAQRNATSSAPPAEKLVESTRRFQQSEGAGANATKNLRSVRDERSAVDRNANGPATLAEPRGWTCRCDLESRRQADGATLYGAVYNLAGAGPGRLRLTMPPGVAAGDLRGLWIDGKPLTRPTAGAEGAVRVTTELPADRGSARVELQWTSSGPPPGIAGSLSPALPESNLPVLACRWTVGLPPDYDFLTLPPDAIEAGPSGWQGWSARRIDFSPDAPPTLTFVHHSSMRLFGTVAFLLVAALGCSAALERPKLLAWLSGGLLLVGLAIPHAYLPPVLGGVFGLFFCLAWRWLRPARPFATLPPQERSAGSTVVRLTAILWLFSVSSIGVAARSETPSDAPFIYRVLVPVDADKRPSGDKVYVPEELYQKLHRAAASTDALQGWLILRATYQAQWAAEAGGGRLGVDALRAIYDLQVFGRFTRVQIPLRAEGASRSPESVLLDGREVPAAWDPTADALTFEVTEPGRYRLEVALHPSPRDDRGHRQEPSGWLDRYGFQDIAQRLIGPFRPSGAVPSYSSAGFDVTIPRVPRSRFELSLSEDAPSIEIPSARGAVVREESPPRLAAELGPADRLSVRWRQSSVTDDVRPIVDAEQLLWLKVQPGSLALSAKFHLRVVEGRIGQVELAVDPRLRLLPPSGDTAPTAHVGGESSQSQLVTFHLPQPVSDTYDFEAAFLLGDAMGVGNFRLPQLELRGARSVQRRMAVSVAPTLDYRQQNQQGLEPTGVDDFLKAWQGPAKAADETTSNPSTPPSAILHPSSAISDPLATPQMAYRLPDGEINWSLSTRPREPRSAADQILSFCCDRRQVDLLYEARLSTASGYLFQHRLAAPKEWKIEKVSLLEGDVERVSRWSRDVDGTVTVFLNDAVSGQQTLTLFGRLPVPPDGVWSPPAVRLEQCDIRRSTVRLYRRPTVRLTIDGVAPPERPAPLRDPSDRFDLGRFVTEYPEDPSQTPSVVIGAESDR